jgi:hypothetical protein
VRPCTIPFASACCSFCFHSALAALYASGLKRPTLSPPAKPRYRSQISPPRPTRLNPQLQSYHLKRTRALPCPHSQHLQQLPPHLGVQYNPSKPLPKKIHQLRLAIQSPPLILSHFPPPCYQIPSLSTPLPLWTSMFQNTYLKRAAPSAPTAST